MTGVCICGILCICVCIVQPERDTLEEKPFILPTDSPVSARDYPGYIDWISGSVPSH